MRTTAPLVRSALALLWLGLVITLSPAAIADTRAPASQAEVRLSYAPVVREAAPAVVNIYARRVVAERFSPFADDPFFGQFFRDFGDARPRVQNSLGSGVILSPEGIVISNTHVVGGATQIRVILADRREYDAEIVMADEESDLAVLRLIGARDLPALGLADSDAVEVGDLVLAIGNPFGIGQTVSAGIVSGLARAGIATLGARSYFLQTDAAINPGNSGGALVDMRGRLVGINTAILTRSGGSQGIGFAIPSNLVARFVEQAEAGERRFVRPWAGAVGQPVDGTLADSLGLPRPEGVILADMRPDSPLAVAGLQVGDVIVSFEGQPVNVPAELLFRMTVHGLGNDAEIEALRGDRRLSVRVPMVRPPETPPRAEVTIVGETPLRGLTAVTINPAVITEYGLPLDASGVLVIGLRDIASRTGLVVGDILLGVNAAPVADTDDLVRAARARGRNWTLDLLREGRRVSLRFRL
ncbi:MAG: trypsin-like peptidase domain-containing protein [Rhodobacteraceae bacterium]|nr:trypsin-like peptidase domain-containing protein [Paracoccaceae bacterium]